MPSPATPYNVAVAVTPSDTVDFAQGPTDAIYVGGAGVVAAMFASGATVNITAVAGVLLPLKVKRIASTGTTATLILALYTD